MTGRWRARWLAAAMALATAGPASATWLKATSRHFVVYSDTDGRALLKQASDLEMFDAVMRHFQHLPENPDAEFNKVTVYVLPSISAVQAIGRMKNIAGFYVGRVTGSVAFTPRQGDDTGQNALSPRIVLFHEYAHHFLLGNYTLAFPAWFSEGFAEFSSTMMEKDGAYWVGAAANHRAGGLFYGPGLTSAQLFAPPARMSDDQTEALYGRGWLLTHLIEFDNPRKQQFARYLTLTNSGTPSAKAATEAFGDLKALDRQLESYLDQSRIPALTIKAETLPRPEVSIRPLTPGEAALIRLRMESTRGVSEKTAGPLCARAKGIAANFPADPVAQGWLAEMAFDAGDDAAAEKAADAVLAVEPTSSQALLYKARVRLRRLAAAKSTDTAAWGEARTWIVRANRAQTNDAAAFALFYEAFGMQGIAPSKGAIAGLYRAVDLVPQDDGLRFAAARQHVLDGDIPAAKAMLRPLAYDPHAGPDNEAAKLLAALDGGAGKTAVEALGRAAEDAGKDAGKPADPAPGGGKG